MNADQIGRDVSDALSKTSLSYMAEIGQGAAGMAFIAHAISEHARAVDRLAAALEPPEKKEKPKPAVRYEDAKGGLTMSLDGERKEP